jgi:hypothetical protein
VNETRSIRFSEEGVGRYLIITSKKNAAVDGRGGPGRLGEPAGGRGGRGGKGRGRMGVSEVGWV